MKITNIKDELENLVTSINNIEEKLIPMLESKFSIKFETPELILLAFTQGDMKELWKSTYESLEARGLGHLLSMDTYIQLAGSGETLRVLAFLEDAILDLAFI